ncbi:hypothetical protein C8R44DRAFT_854055 [Mycena epipterygia]|nr:hypothetical protein C8R44DRAFT_854055 [Mycena epipterygia]
MASGSSSASSSSSASGSASPEPEIRPTKKNKSKAAEKTKSKAAEKTKSTAKSTARNEGTDPHWAYAPPHKSVRLEASADVGEFDWDALNGDDDLELWLVRIPEGVKPKYLETAQLELPARRDSKSSAKLGVLQRKHVAYDIWSVGDDAPEALPIGGEEIKALSCLLPRKSKKGKLYAAPTPIARTVVMAAQAVKPTPDPANAATPNAPPVYKNPPRESHPKELLTHSFLPYGATVGSAEEGEVTTPMDVDKDGEVLVPETPAKAKEDSKKLKGKKRKGAEDGESPKKPKKAKTAS